tara:strand:+ start:455 stop:1183 length:729 start_codon:yes stop_codon:yes gene_type:complete
MVNDSNIEEIQKKAFSNLELSYDDGLELFSRIYSKKLKKFNKPTSHHQILFSSISLRRKIKKILEIGTYDGTNAKFLSCLFPEAKIITLDLKDNDPLFIKTYKRDDKTYRMRFIDMRNSILNSCHNVQFIQENSVNYLYFETQKYDLIWVDGAHGYPVVSIDILNSLKLLDKNGYLICDDIFQKVDKSDPVYRSMASMETLVSFLNAKIISKVSLIIKRFISKQKKFIAVIEEKNVNKSKNE